MTANWTEPLLSAVRCYLGTTPSPYEPATLEYLRLAYGHKYNPVPDGNTAAMWIISIELANTARSRYRTLNHWQAEGRNYKAADKERTAPLPPRIEVRYP